MIHSLKIDGDIEEKLKEFNEKLPSAEKIVSFHANGDYLFVHTETNVQERSRDRNLLLEEFDRQARDRTKRG